jgi:hypothetical protein
MRHAVSVAMLTIFWLGAVFSAIWLAIYFQFLVMLPRQVQRDLFGSEIVGVSSLRAAHDDCCLFPLPDGYRDWTYEVSQDLAHRLAAPCSVVAPPDGLGLMAGDARTCVVARRLFGPNGMNGRVQARLVGNRLVLSVDTL